jgi:hypothetical protein
LARGICYKQRHYEMASRPYAVPTHVNYDLWLGPAPAAPLTRRRFHYDWHWQWPYGNGELGNQGVQQLDICRWGIQFASSGQRVVSFGSRSPTRESAWPPALQVTEYCCGDKAIVMEMRGLGGLVRHRGRVGVIFEGSDGYLVMTSYHSGTAFDLQGRPIHHFRGGGGTLHLVNFLDAVRHRSCRRLNADIEEGHASSVLAHIGNISYRLGVELPWTELWRRLDAADTLGNLAATRQRTEPYLREQGEGHSAARGCLGRLLVWDPAAEQFVGDPLASELLTRKYRRPYVVPDAGSA